MPISSISPSSAAASATTLTANQAAIAQSQVPTVQSANQTGSSQTTVTLSAAAAAAQGVPAAANTGALSIALYKSYAAAQNSTVILSIGQQHMAAAMESFNNDWTAAKQVIGAQRPDLLNKSWDIVTDQGTIQVVSNTLSDSDKAWLTGILNQNKNLVADTQTINTIAVSTFGGTAAMAADDTLGMTLTSLNQNSVDGKLHFLTLLGENNGKIFNTSSVGQIAPWGSPGTQGSALNAAFVNYLEPEFFSTSVPDGTNPLAGQNIDTQGLTSSDVTLVVNQAMIVMGALTSTSGRDEAQSGGYNESFLTLAEQTLPSILDANYRTYGEALTATGTSNSSTGSASQLVGQATANQVQSTGQSTQTSAPASTATSNSAKSASSVNSSGSTTGVNAIQDVYEEDGQILSGVQKAIAPAMQKVGADWNGVKSAIAAQRPDLLSQNWDFVTDNGTVQVVSSTLTAEQKSWLTGMLNQSSNLVADTQTVNNTLVNFYKTPVSSSASTTGSTPIGLQKSNASTGSTLSSLTPQSIDGAIPFLALMAGADPTSLILQSLKNQSLNSG
ncbi:MAG: hypothetical protein P4L91_03510 [Burkholderiaceae bacterium]|nr:hypothetical protein [Burkholderiaceae bacterium]